MKIELRNVKHAKFASQETDCFQASVYINGKRMGTVCNEGRGGPNGYHPTALFEALTGYAKTLPKVLTEYDDPTDPSKKWEFELDADCVIDDALKRWQYRDLMMRAMRDRVVFINRAGDLMQTGRLSKERLTQIVDNPSLLGDATTILNRLNPETALELYMAHSK